MRLILSLFIAFGFSAAADSFTVIRDGQEYLCQQTSPTDPDAPRLCAEKAYSGPYSRAESIELCTSARSIAPADCGIKAYSGPFGKLESIQLCKMALSVSPADCGAKAYSGPFNKEQSVELCARTGTLAHADCAIRAYSGPYSKEEAIAMCKANPALMMKALKNIPVQVEKLKDFRDSQLAREVEWLK